MDPHSAASVPPATPEPQRVRRQTKVLAGLLLTFAGLLLASGALPTDPGALRSTIPIVGGALLAVWVGGILLGVARGQGSRRPASR